MQPNINGIVTQPFNSANKRRERSFKKKKFYWSSYRCRTVNEEGKQNGLFSHQAGGSPLLCSWKMLVTDSNLSGASCCGHYSQLARWGWERRTGQLQETAERPLLTRTGPLRRTAPDGRRLALTHTWTCSAVQKEPGTSVGLVTLHVSMHLERAPMVPSPPAALWEDTGAPQGPLHWTPEVFCIILTGFHKETSQPAPPWGEVWRDRTPNDNTGYSWVC